MSDFSGSPPSSAIAFGVLSILLGANGVSFSATLASDSQLNFPEIPVHVSIISIVIYLAVLLAISAASTVLDKIRMLKQMLAPSIFNLEELDKTRVTQAGQITHGKGLADALDAGGAF